MPLKIEVQKIQAGGERLAGSIPRVETDMDLHGLSLQGDLEYDLHAELVSGELLVRGRLALPVIFTCSRCLKNFPSTVRVENFIFTARVSDKDTIDLTDNLREDIIIALPLKPLCREGCAGICPRCGKDLNVEQCSCGSGGDDARWRALEQLSLPPENE